MSRKKVAWKEPIDPEFDPFARRGVGAGADESYRTGGGTVGGSS